MKTKTNLLAAGILLAALATSFGQSTLQFSTNIFNVVENAGSALLTVQRTGDTNTEVSVAYASANLSAIAGSDYTTINGTLTFAAGETNQTIVVPILNDGLAEPSAYETFTVSLSNPTNAVLGTRTTASVRITDNDKALQFEFADYWAREDEGSVLIGVTRGDDGNFPVSVDFATSNLTATNGLDYVATNGTLLFAAGEKVKLFTIPILNDGLKESSETFRVTLSNPTNQILGSPRIATITITDNDLGVQFELNQYWVQETDGTLTVQVLRGNDLELLPFTVDFATSNLTATAGSDYTGTNMTLAFAQGEMVKIITVPILYDESSEADERFKMTLSNPTGAVLGPYTTATNTILDTTGMKPHMFDRISVLPDGCVQLSLKGGVHTRFQNYFDLYPIEASTNLVDWTPLVTLLRTNANTNALVFADTSAAPFNQRFYGTCSNHFLTPFPKPTGPYAVGTFSLVLTDPTRRNRYNLSTNSSFMSTFWYPAQPPGAGTFPGSYTDKAVANDQAFYDGWGWSSQWPGIMPQFMAHSTPGIPLASGTNRFPVILHSHGYTCDRTLNSQSAAELASHGYIVAAVDHEDCHATVYPDARGVRYSTITDYYAVVRSRTNDLKYLLDELILMDGPDAVLSGRLDLDRIGAMGFSLGAATAAEIGRLDNRVKCVALLDAYINPTYFPGLASQGLQKPFLAMNRTIVDDGHGLEDFSPYTQPVYNLATTDATWLKIRNTGHFAFCDFAWFVEMTPYSRQGAVAINACLLWFFDTYLKGEAPPFPTNPEISNLQRK